MKCPRRVSCLLVFGFIASASLPCVADVPLNGLTEAEKRGGWKLLFDGETTKGWRNYRKDGTGKGWVVENGILSRTKGGAGDIITTEQFKYFELSIEYRISKGGNSGIMFHVTEEGGASYHTGPEIQIQDNVFGGDPQKAGWLYQLYKPKKPAWAKKFEAQVGYKGIEMDDATRPHGEWNQVYLRISPKGCETAMNGVSYYYFKVGDEDWNKRVAKSKFTQWKGFGKAGKGHICLQDHGNLVSFRNIKLRVLNEDGEVPEPIDGKLALKGVPAFPDLNWEGWSAVSEEGKVKPLRPMVLTHANDATNRVFVASQIGLIHVFKNDPKAKKASLFLDIRSKVQDWAKDDEEGLLGMALHPEYLKTGEIYVYYSSSKEPRTSIVSRFRRSKDDPNKADPDSEEIVMKIPQPFANHNGGSIAFGHDGYLYIALGDGGGRNDPVQHGQNLKTLMGCVLRIDVDKKDNGLNYAIPKDNPFRIRKDAKPEIYAYGFRNIWRLTVDRKTGSLWAGDVGQDLWEEVNIVKKGGNYGWSIRESTHLFNNNKATNDDNPIDPIWEYDHQVGKSITGGFVYRGDRLPELKGKYLYADYVTGKIWGLEYDEANSKVVKNLGIISGGIPVISFGEDEDGEVYYLMQSTTGRGIYKFERSKS